MNMQPYVPSASPSQPQRELCPDCQLILFVDGICPNPTCPSNTPTEIAVRAPDPNCPMCCGTGKAAGLPFCWQCG